MPRIAIGKNPWHEDMELVLDGIEGKADSALSGLQGRVVGPAAAVTNRLVAFDGTTGKLVKDSGKAVTDLVLATEKGAVSGVATLDSGGKVPAGQLPSYVDDALEYANLAAFPASGTAGIIYVALDTSKTYRWSGSAYVEISPSEVNSVAGKTGSVTLVKADITDLGTIGTAASKNTGVESGDVPLLSTGGVLPIARIATGIPDGTKFVRDDGTLVDLSATIGEHPDVLDKVVRGEQVVNLFDPTFGALGDGTTDDSVAVQAFFDHLAVNGGKGIASSPFIVNPVFKLVSLVSVLDPASPVAFTFDGDNSVTFLAAHAASANVLAFRNLDGATFRNYKIDGGVAANTAHGMSMSSCRDTTVENVTVKTLSGVGVLFFKSTSVSGDSLRNHIIRSVCHGGGVAEVGFLHEGSTASTTEHCQVYNLNRTGTPGPGYGLELKNNCVGCEIIGGYVDGAVAGVAFGYDDGTAWMRGNRVTGVVVTNVNYGFLGSRMEHNVIDITVLMANDAACLNAVMLAGNANSNTVTVRPANPNAAATLVFIQEKNNAVTIEGVNVLGSAALALFDTASATNTLTIGTIGDKTAFSLPTLPITNNGAATNQVGFRVKEMAQHSLSTTGNSYVYFTAPDQQSAYIYYNHTSEFYGFRVNGTDELALYNTDARPGADLGLALGTTSRRFTELWTKDGMIASSPDGTKYRIGVANGGTIVITAV